MSKKNEQVVRIANWEKLGVIKNWIRNHEQLGKEILDSEGVFKPGTTLEQAEALLAPIRKKWTGKIEIIEEIRT